jgi:16S rRNA (uracil1498-N3)-methyltransferase
MKKTHRFLVEHIPAGDSFAFSNEHAVHQIGTVLKFVPGEELIVFVDGGDDIVVRIQEISKKEITAQKLRTIPALPAPVLSLTAAISIPKSDTFEFIVQKLTELGVSRIIPIRSSRTVKQSVRLDRLRAISDEALEQCGGNRRVMIDEATDLSECLSHVQIPAIVFDVSGDAEMPVPQESGIMYIGPEGGWSDEDLALFRGAGSYTVTLGPRTLRTDTAAITGAYHLLWT